MNFFDGLKMIIGAMIAVILFAGILQLAVVAMLAAGVLAIAVIIYFMFKKQEGEENGFTR